MAISDNTTSQNTGFAAPGSAAPSAQAPAAAPQQTIMGGGDRPLSLFGLGPAGGIVRSLSSEALTKGFEAVQSAIKDSHISQALKVLGLKIDNQSETSLKLSSIVLVLQHQQTNRVAHHTLLLEGSAEPLGSKTEVVPGTGLQVQIDRYASEVYDSVYLTAVENSINAHFPNAKIINTGATVVPRNFPWTEVGPVRKLVQNAMFAAATYIEAQMDVFQDLDMSKLSGAEQLQVSIGWEQSPATDYTGLPVRTDIQIVTTAVAAQRNNSGSLNSQNDSKIVSRVGGFLDLSYVPPDLNAQYQQGNQIGSKRCYRARMILTSIENDLRLTPAGQLLAVASALALTEGTTYYRGFKPRLSQPAMDKFDIGATNIEANLENDKSGFGTPLDTKSSSFDDRELGTLLNAVVYPGLVVSVDVSDAGSDTWFNRVFAQAARGDADANRELLKAANKLTGGKFAGLYGNSNFPAMIAREERVLMGYYINKDGQMADIRDVDYLTMLNYHGSKNPKVVTEWSDTIERMDLSLPLRLQERKTLIRATVEQVTFTQLATRATFHPEFLKTLIMALNAANVGYKLISTGAGDYSSQRAGGSFNDAAFGMGQTGLFNQGFTGAAAQSFARPFQPGSMF